MSKALTKSDLNYRQKLFCIEYLKDFNGSEAAIRAGYSKNTARIQAAQLLTKTNIQDEIIKQSQKIFRTSEIEVQQLVSHLIRLTNYDISEIYDDQGRLKHPKDWPEDLKHVIQGVETVEISEGRGDNKEYYYTHKVKMPDRVRPAELLGKYLKMFIETIEHKGEVKLIVQPASKDDGGNGKLQEGDE